MINKKIVSDIIKNLKQAKELNFHNYTKACKHTCNSKILKNYSDIEENLNSKIEKYSKILSNIENNTI